MFSNTGPRSKLRLIPYQSYKFKFKYTWGWQETSTFGCIPCFVGIELEVFPRDHLIPIQIPGEDGQWQTIHVTLQGMRHPSLQVDGAIQGLDETGHPLS